MTWFLSVRSQDVGGPVVPAELVESLGGAQPSYTPMPTWGVTGEDDGRAIDLFTGRHLVIAVHGFNVSRPKAVRAMVTLERALALPSDSLFLGVLWPGDSWIPVVNYPTEASDAVRAGGYVADFLNRHAAGALSFNLISHSLGGRVLLETVRRLQRSTRQACITAGALEDDCLHGQYGDVPQRSERVSVLASREDHVLRLAYPIGDFFSVLFGSGDNPFQSALGLAGPEPTETWPRVSPRQIPDAQGYDHGDYFPPSDGSAAPGRWTTSVGYMRRAMAGDPDRWP